MKAPTPSPSPPLPPAPPGSEESSRSCLSLFDDPPIEEPHAHHARTPSMAPHLCPRRHRSRRRRDGSSTDVDGGHPPHGQQRCHLRHGSGVPSDEPRPPEL